MRKKWQPGIEEVYLFDFDGTITKSDSMFSFLKFHIGGFRFMIRLLRFAPYLFFGLLKGRSRKDLKERMLQIFLRNNSREELLEKSLLHFQSKGVSLIRPAALSFLQGLDRNKSSIVIVTASLDIWVEPFARFLNAELIATKSLFSADGYFMGIDGNNCSHDEKVVCLAERYDWQSFSGKKFAFGNSSGDAAMYAFADEYHHCKFH